MKGANNKLLVFMMMSGEGKELYKDQAELRSVQHAGVVEYHVGGGLAPFGFVSEELEDCRARPKEQNTTT